MAGQAAAAAAISTGDTAAKKPRKEEEDEDDSDNLPLAVSRGKKASNASASKVKKEEEEDDDDEFENLPISHSRAKKGNEKLKRAMSSAKASKVKKEENDSDDDFELTVRTSSGGAAVSARTPKVKKIKDEDLNNVKITKKRVSVKDAKTGTRNEDKEKVKKERKVYDLPGQKHDPPEERDPLRIFYESLYEQISTSEMAATWLMEWGLLPLDVARKVFEKKQGQKLKSPIKTTSKRMPASPAKKVTPSSAKKTGSTASNAGKITLQKKRKASSDSDSDDDDFMAPKAKTKRQKASS